MGLVGDSAPAPLYRIEREDTFVLIFCFIKEKDYIYHDHSPRMNLHAAIFNYRSKV
jgi:hypothetical protein